MNHLCQLLCFFGDITQRKSIAHRFTSVLLENAADVPWLSVQPFEPAGSLQWHLKRGQLLWEQTRHTFSFIRIVVDVTTGVDKRHQNDVSERRSSPQGRSRCNHVSSHGILLTHCSKWRGADEGQASSIIILFSL